MKRFFFIPVFAMLLAGGVISCSPGNDTFLDDRADILTESERKSIGEYNEVLLSALDIHFKLIILDSAAEDIDEIAASIFSDLGVETQGARGLLYLVDPKGEQVKIEVGYDLESVFTDGFVGYIEAKQLVPFFEIGKVGPGVAAATELFVSQVMRVAAGDGLDAEAEKRLPPQEYYSGGGGAKISVAVGSKTNLEKAASAVEFDAQPSPARALEEYKKVLRTHIKDPQLGLFTPETRDFLAKWVVTDAQQDNELRSLAQSTPEKIIISEDRAVIRFPAANRNQAPYFLQKGPEGWMLDFWTMTNVIQMNHKNMWFFKKQDHLYMFGFADWRFDQTGFAIIAK